MGDWSHGTTNIDTKQGNDIGDMRVAVILGIAKLLIDPVHEGKHKCCCRNLVDKRAKDHAQNTKGNCEGPWIPVHEFLAHEFCNQT